MFTLNHFILIGACALAVTGLLIWDKFKPLPFDKVITALTIGATISECIKIFSSMIEGYGGGMHLDPLDLPFHLCSIQLFLIYALKFFVKSEITREKILGFMSPMMLLGGFLAIMIPTEGVDFTVAQVYQYFFYHAMLIFFSLYIIRHGLVNWSVAVLLRNARYLGAAAFFATLLNSILYPTSEEVNFFFLVRPPMENLPIINLNNGWFGYIATLFAIAVVLIGGFHAILILLQKKSLDKKSGK